jgi:hypothetical protein
MSIYSKKHRSVYEQYHGPIPIDEFGRTYEVHHIDGNHSNNDPNNLIAVTIQEHYDIHHSQGDYGACQAISIRMETPPEKISSLARLAMKKRVLAKTNHHHREDYRKKIKKIQDTRVENGTHHTKTEEWSSMCSANNKKRIENGTHPFVGKNAEKIKRKTGKDHHRFNPTVYSFENVLTGEVVTSTVLEFTTKYNVIRNNLDQLIAGKGRRKTVSGWRLLIVSETNEAGKP